MTGPLVIRRSGNAVGTWSRRRGHAAAGPWRGPHSHHPELQRLGRRRRVQRSPGAAPLFRATHRSGHGLADNPVGRLIEDLVLQGGVDISHVRWAPYDGIGRAVRNGLNFTERGFGVRAALGCSDRGHSAASQLRPGQLDWDRIFSAEGARWFHTGGIFAALVGEHRRRGGRGHGCRSPGGSGRLLRPQLPAFSVEGGGRNGACRGGEPAARGYDRRPFRQRRGLQRRSRLRGRRHRRFLCQLGTPRATQPCWPGWPPSSAASSSSPPACGRCVRPAATTGEASAGLAARFFRTEMPEDLEILDRVGGGDGFASGLMYGLLAGLSVEEALRYGVAHGALAMTTPGDTSMATLAEVSRLVAGGSARVVR